MNFQISCSRGVFSSLSNIFDGTKKCPYSELFWSVFSHISTEYGEMRNISPYLVRMQENADQNNSEYGHLPRSGYFSVVGQSVVNYFCKKPIIDVWQEPKYSFKWDLFLLLPAVKLKNSTIIELELDETRGWKPPEVTLTKYLRRSSNWWIKRYNFVNLGFNDSTLTDI